jgi:glycosyltransferase involved in cell wall biosynthesis
MLEPARVAKELGVDIVIDMGIDVEATMDKSTGLSTVTEVKVETDLIVIQRPLDNSWTSVLEQAKKQGIATIVELDDDFDTIHTQNIAHTNMTAYEHTGAHWVKSACEIADHVTISTPTLEKYGIGKSTVLRNCVPESIFDFTPVYDLNREPVTVGWTGTTQVHPLDLQMTKGAIGSVVAENGLNFAVVGDGVDVQRFLGLSKETPFTATGWVELENYYETLRDSMDIGIVPLEMSPFNHAKSALKGMEMAALGIPFVASPTREYERFEAYGVGKLASGPTGWSKAIQRWIDRPKTRDSDARKYREIVYNENTIERNASQWVETWERTISSRKSQK